MATRSIGNPAAESMTGYLYQCRYALWAALNKSGRQPNLSVSIERFDDVAFDSNGSPRELIQTKHHIARHGRLTDASVDLWKTLGIWLEAYTSGALNLAEANLFLITTAEAPLGSAASMLKPISRDVSAASQALLGAAIASKNETTQSMRKIYMRLTPSQRSQFLTRVYVLDSSPDITNVHDEICMALRWNAPKGKAELLVERLEGWWIKTVIEALVAGNCSIPVRLIEDKIYELSQGFEQDALPVDFADAELPKGHLEQYDERPFIKQLRLIRIGDRRVSLAARDYYRAFQQRSQWTREELIFDAELSSYDRELEEAWEPRFAEMQDSLGGVAEAERKIEKAQELFKWAEQDASTPLRSVSNRFLCHGSYHMLADRYRVGWHPDFADKLASQN